jgi:DNA (cytosine-5)-methyltransferase 1
MGYHQAGFDVFGVDVVEQPNYPFDFLQCDALKFLAEYDLNEFDVIHASPPCQGYSRLRHLHPDRKYPTLISRTRNAIRRYAPGKPYVIENVEGSQTRLIDPVVLCGSSFGLRVRRHRFFECSHEIQAVGCDHDWQNRHKPYRIHNGRVGHHHSGVLPVYGNAAVVGGRSLFLKSVAMGIDWMSEDEINQAVPPAFTRHIGTQLLGAVRSAA